MFLNIVAEVFCTIKGAMIVPRLGIIRLARLGVIQPPDTVGGATSMEYMETSDVRYWLLYRYPIS